jgi:agmatine/peptidylarginine deiminase
MLAGDFVGPVLPRADEEPLPRSLTDAEREWLKENPLGGASIAAPSPPPTGPIDPVAEYDPMEGLVVSYGVTGSWPVNWRNILAQIARRVTVEGASRMYVGVPDATAQNDAISRFTSNGVDLSRVTFFTVPLNSIWARDYGPRYVYEGNVRIITDHQYNRPRPLDNASPGVFGTFKQHKYYEIGFNSTTLVHGGGNYHLATDGDAYATRLINNENPSLTEAQIKQVWQTYQNNSVTITDPFPTTVDATQHIDMWMQIFDDRKAFISDWPNNPGSIQDNICDSTAALLQSRGYQVTRIPAYSISGTHYTFTNMVICNNVVLLPQYNNGPGATVSNQVLSTVQAAFGAGKTVYQINADSIVTAAGVFHCIVQHVPMHRGLAGPGGGLAPTAFLRGPNNAPTLTAGSQYTLEWISDDDAPGAGGVTSVTLQLSLDGGSTWPITIATNRPALGSFNWTVPSGINTTTARVRAVAFDAQNNSGFDVSDADFTIVDPASPPAVTASSFIYQNLPQRVNFTFNQNVGASLGVGDFLVENLSTSGTVTPTGVSFDAPSGVATLSLPGILPNGNYRVTVLAAGVFGPTGVPMAQNHVFNFRFLQGDADGNGVIDFDDYALIDNGFLNGLTGYANGDFNYDGVIDFDDYAIIDFNFLNQ